MSKSTLRSEPRLPFRRAIAALLLLTTASAFVAPRRASAWALLGLNHNYALDGVGIIFCILTLGIGCVLDEKGRLGERPTEDNLLAQTYSEAEIREILAGDRAVHDSLLRQGKAGIQISENDTPKSIGDGLKSLGGTDSYVRYVLEGVKFGNDPAHGQAR
jgi:hypothetical protein